jgi:hypothetical protein
VDRYRKVGFKAFEKYLVFCPAGAILRHFPNEHPSLSIKQCKDKRVQQKPQIFSVISIVIGVDGAISGESSYLKAPTNE